VVKTITFFPGKAKAIQQGYGVCSIKEMTEKGTLAHVSRKCKLLHPLCKIVRIL
jgi:hypothetical protein